MKLLEKLQKQPEKTRKIILWGAIIIIGIALFILWVTSIKRSISNFQKEKFIEGLNLSGIEGEMNNLPEIEIPIPNISDEQLKQIEEEIKKAETSEGAENKTQPNGGITPQ